ncbi:MAG: acyltransferase domain-containing protein [candidate division KSB1 bacterium]|nr:acyltransferase domain-containing protein [candidate division KSB1 bacterium]MDZ7275826.1 acyltransferase domain-containing protein [candidate division KSB1 bacterium]MDZ7287576.1 acyltransferase domain-containing protein [candidate division KSB1 bacterium]MDZ7307504.1 acyltransferase domain-containing protein [candidate division KSB1 bacterium]MDZ7350554.1 acyltransferase domain-containing protein [candidate division KSB1 bacterium]
MANAVEQIEQRDQLSPVKRALLEIRELKARLAEAEAAKNEPIAIIGMGLRFPGGAHDPESAWRMLRDGVDAIREVPPDRWNIEAFYDPDPDQPGKMSTRWGGFIDHIDHFDADFFGISPREAMSMDPQQRLLLTVAWEALEHAGQAPDKLMGSRTGVFIGIAAFDYPAMQMQFLEHHQIDAYYATGSSHSIASGRLSYFFGLQGPSISLDTACSSSLVCVHLACNSLRQRECNLALAGGVNLIIAPELLINFSKAHMMAGDGRCKTFDAAADGFVRGEGAALVVLKRLSDALADRDNILAVIRGSAVNQDGRSSGITAPNGPSQKAVIRQALQNAGVSAAEIGYVETHGTGTALGDPIEAQALGAVMAEARRLDQPVAIGSIKTNIGHLETAAGVAGLIKVVLAMQHGQIPPHLNLRTPSPHIPWQELPLTVPTRLTPWPAVAGRRLGAVSSFGFSGTNAHIIVEGRDFAPPAGGQPGRSRHLLTLSARSAANLQELAGRYVRHFAENPALPAADVCFTANTGRAHFDHRLAIVAADTVQLQQKLSSFLAQQEAPGVMHGRCDLTNRPEVVFLFTGQGGQYANMGRRLFETQPVFRAALERCAEILRAHLDRPLWSVLFPQPGEEGLLDQTNYTQPATFALQYALAELWRSWGVVPGLIMGHSVGEIVAATVAGMMSLEDGLMIVSERGRLMHSLPHTGLMASILAGEKRVAEALAGFTDRVAIAALNGPESTVISGERQAVMEILQRLEAQGIKSKLLQVSNSFHSPLVEPVLDEFEASCRRASYRPPATALFSSMRLALVDANHLLDAAYWRHNLRHTVRYAEAMQALHQMGYRIFLELGPAPILVVMGQKCFPAGEGVWLPSLRQGRDEEEQMLDSLASLYVHGVELDWAGFDRPFARRRVALPATPMSPKSYWLEELKVWQQGFTPKTASRWEEVEEAGHYHARQVPMDLALHTYPAKWACLDRLTSACIVKALRQLGIFKKTGVACRVAECLAQFQIQPTYRNLLRRWFEKLTAEGVLTRAGEGYVRHKPWPRLTAEAILAKDGALFADIPALLEYLQRCGRMLVPVLTGGESPLETLFPGGTNATSEFLYHEWALSRYYTGIVRGLAQALVRTLPATQPLRVLEIGAGTGGTTAAILPVLPATRTLYYFTDMSEYFFTQAAERFRAYPFLRYGILNIENPPAEQGFGSHDFDIVVAANVLHATKNLHATVENTRALLKPGGALILYETTHHPHWFDISIGLIEGWQLFEDDLRSDNPLLPTEKWQALLREHGFEKVAAFPEAGSPAEILNQHVFLARMPLAREGVQMQAVTAGSSTPATGPAAAVESAAAEAGETLVQRLQSLPPAERFEQLIEYVRRHVVKVLRRDPDQTLGRRQRLMEVGIDSLMAVELRNLLARGLGMTTSLPATLIFDYPNIEAIARLLEKMVFADGESAGVTATRSALEGNGKTVTAEEIAALSEEEVAAMLERKLEAI